jgi:hypothetical protein
VLVSVSGKTVGEVKEKLAAIAKAFGLSVTEEKTEKRVRSPNKKNETQTVEAVAEVEVASPKIEETVPTDALVKETPMSVVVPSISVVATKEAAMDALKDLNAKRGLPVAREVLLKFQASRFSELKEADFGAFIEACREITQ